MSKPDIIRDLLINNENISYVKYGFKGSEKQFSELKDLMSDFTFDEFVERFDYEDLFEDPKDMKKLHDDCGYKID